MPYTPEQIRSYGNNMLANGGSYGDMAQAARQFGVPLSQVYSAYGMSNADGRTALNGQSQQSGVYDFTGGTPQLAAGSMQGGANAIGNYLTQNGMPFNGVGQAVNGLDYMQGGTTAGATGAQGAAQSSSPYTADQIRSYGTNLLNNGGSYSDLLGAANQYGVSFGDLSGAFGMSPEQGAQYMVDHPIAGQQAAPGSNTDYMNFGSQSSNPYLQQQGNAIRDQVTQTLQQQWLPQIQSSAIGSGGLGGTRQGVAQGVAMGNAATGLSSALSNLYGNAYENDANRALQNQGQWFNYDTQSRANDRADYGMGLNGLTTAANLPWTGLLNASGIYNTAAGNNVTGTTGSQSGGGWQGLLGGLLGGGQFASNMGWF